MSNFARVLSVIVLVLLGSPLLAQSTYRLQWEQPNATLAQAQGYSYSLKVDAAAATAITATCAGTTAITCSTPMPVLAAGSHTLVVTATNGFGSASSAPFPGSSPSAPINLTVIVNVTIP